MGCSPFSRRCSCDSGNSEAIAPNPSPERWEILEKHEYPNGYVLLIKYEDCTNFEGKKILVYRGRFEPMEIRDPHFSGKLDSPIARFRPDVRGMLDAMTYASGLELLGMQPNKFL